MESALAELAMQRSRFAVKFTDRSGVEAEWTDRGADAVEFHLSPNPGEDLRPLARIASGGELSRIMLAFKALVANRTPGTSMVFDEVDAGIGGRVAHVVGQRLRQLAERSQALCITHLPQIAAYATTHFEIEKKVHGRRTVTTVKRLSAPERMEELARMLGGARITEQARASARELLDQARDGIPARPGSEYKSKGERAKAKERNAWRART
jgi:DNA repair protein RecN (Recombination protein N)